MLYRSPNSESYQDFLSLVIALGFSSFRGGIVHFYHLGNLSKPAGDGLSKNLVSFSPSKRGAGAAFWKFFQNINIQKFISKLHLTYLSY